MKNDPELQNTNRDSHSKDLVDEETLFSDEHGLPMILQRRRTKLVKPERSSVILRKPVVANKSSNKNELANNSNNKDETGGCDLWITFAYSVTFWAFPSCLSACGKKDHETQRAWREKMALIFVIIACCAALAFLTFGLQVSICTQRNDRASFEMPPSPNAWAVGGLWYNIPEDLMQQLHPKANLKEPGSQQASQFFINSVPSPSCDALNVQFKASKCTFNGVTYCHSTDLSRLGGYAMGIEVSYEWANVTKPNSQYIVYNGIILDMGPYLAEQNPFLGEELDSIIRKYLGQDVTRKVQHKAETIKVMQCLIEKYKVGFLEKESRGCFASNVINYIALVVILGLVFSRFIMAIIYHWCVAPNLANPSRDPAPFYAIHSSSKKAFYQHDNSSTKKPSFLLPITSRFSANNRSNTSIEETKVISPDAQNSPPIPKNVDTTLPHVIMLVTCYSEGEQEIRNTLESLADTDYSDKNKIFFIVADGLVQSGDGRLTPDICIKLLELDSDSTNPVAKSCLAVADGYKQNNMAKVYSGYFRHKNHRVPAVLVVKCGTEMEKNERKPGNRGKRDSQIVLMNFLSKVMFDDRMTPLEYELFTKMTKVAGVTPDHYEHVLMIDADTKVMRDSLPLLVNTMKNDVTIMGVCGETRIANKTASWVTAIQVYEYFVSHHLAKGFESMFGGVTCLPGCFAMYRIKAPKFQDVYWVPILANPDVVEIYSNNVVDTLHKKNLFSLGEDRFLTTLMLKTFPKRKMVFVPQAICKTEVPSKFSVLLSQRRRWINSTVHNLMELVFVKDLCGTFCFSMQMVVALELFGTVVLPAAIVFTGFLIASIFMPKRSFMEDSLIPLIMLVSILMLPGFLVIINAHGPSYIIWMFVYLAALPVWNFILPLYAFWHFDDFGWGKTRAVAGDDGKDSHGTKEGVFDASNVVMKRWNEWEKERRKNLMIKNEPVLVKRRSIESKIIEEPYPEFIKNIPPAAGIVQSNNNKTKSVRFSGLDLPNTAANLSSFAPPVMDNNRSSVLIHNNLHSTNALAGIEPQTKQIYNNSSSSAPNLIPHRSFVLINDSKSESDVKRPLSKPPASVPEFVADDSRLSVLINNGNSEPNFKRHSSRTSISFPEEAKDARSSIIITGAPQSSENSSGLKRYKYRNSSSVPNVSSQMDQRSSVIISGAEFAKSEISLKRPLSRPPSSVPDVIVQAKDQRSSVLINVEPQVKRPSSRPPSSVPEIFGKGREDQRNSVLISASRPSSVLIQNHEESKRPVSRPPSSVPDILGKANILDNRTSMIVSTKSETDLKRPISRPPTSVPDVVKGKERSSVIVNDHQLSKTEATIKRPLSRPPASVPEVLKGKERSSVIINDSQLSQSETYLKRPMSRPPSSVPDVVGHTKDQRSSVLINVDPQVKRPSSRPPSSVPEIFGKGREDQRSSVLVSASRPASVHMPSSTEEMKRPLSRPPSSVPDILSQRRSSNPDNRSSMIVNNDARKSSVDMKRSFYKASSSVPNILELGSRESVIISGSKSEVNLKRPVSKPPSTVPDVLKQEKRSSLKSRPQSSDFTPKRPTSRPPSTIPDTMLNDRSSVIYNSDPKSNSNMKRPLSRPPNAPDVFGKNITNDSRSSVIIKRDSLPVKRPLSRPPSSVPGVLDEVNDSRSSVNLKRPTSKPPTSTPTIIDQVKRNSSQKPF